MNKKQRISFYSALAFISIIGITSLCWYFSTKESPKSDINYALSLYQKGKYEKAMRYFEQADKDGVSEATFALGAMYFAGLGTKVDTEKALFLYHKAAQANYTPAQTTLSLLYMQGKVVKQDKQSALVYARNAAENGDMEAQVLLAKWFEDGQYIESDMKKAVYFYEMAAKQGNKNAKIALSAIYKSGKGSIPMNIFTAKRWEDSIQKQKRFENIFQNLPPDYIEKAQ